MRAGAGFALVALLALPGCLDTLHGTATCPPSALGTGRHLTDLGLDLDPRQPFDVVDAWWGAPPNTTATQLAATPPAGWDWRPIDLHSAPGSRFLVGFHYTPPGSASAASKAQLGLAYVVHTATATCAAFEPVSMSCLCGPVVEGQVAQPGQGVHAWYAAFLANGTLLDTNVQGIDRSDQPRVSYYQSEPYKPIPVYVYGQDRSEEPAYWKDPLASAPAPLAPVDDAAGVGYFTTIRGFNEALKGLSTTTTRAVYVAPQDAYTDAAHKDSPLYGEALVFLIKLADVVNAPCPAAVPRVVGCPG